MTNRVSTVGLEAVELPVPRGRVSTVGLEAVVQPLIITLSPSPITTATAVPAPAIGLGLRPGAVIIATFVPMPWFTGIERITPAPVALTTAVPAPTLPRPLSLQPGPVATAVPVPVPVVFVAASALFQPFYLGSVHATLDQPWTVIGPVVTSTLEQPFELAGTVGSALDQPFGIDGPVMSRLDQPFELLAIGAGPTRRLPWQPMMVFDKTGRYLGAIREANVVRAPTRYLRGPRVANEGGMTFAIPRSSPDAGLIASDRLVRLQSIAGEMPWVGTMAPHLAASGIWEVECRDPWTLLRDGPAIRLTEEVSDGTPAIGVYARIMALHNDLRAGYGEVQWELDLQGSRPFRGDLALDDNTLGCLDVIIRRSRTEIAWDSRLDGNRLVLILRVRDRFEVIPGAAIFDGPNGNVLAGPRAVEDPSELVHSIRLRGLTTDLAACLPAWAHWAIADVTPEITVSVDPGPNRMRQRLEESLDWGLSKAAVAAQCNAIVDWIWGLYRSFLMAVHDIEGRPWHEGWAYLGPPERYEPRSAGVDSLSRRAWKTRLQLVEQYPDEPLSAVMLSDRHCLIDLRQWLVVRYNRVTGVQSVHLVALPTAAGLSLIKWSTTGPITRFRVSGGRIVERRTLDNPGTGAYVDPYSVRVWDPVARRHRNLRRIISGPMALAWYIDPGDADNRLTDLGPDAAIDTTDGDGSSFIGKVYPFEADRIAVYDPRREGIGVERTWATAFNGTVTNRPRWHVGSFNVGSDAETSLVAGISATDTDFAVESIWGFPDPDLDAAEFPFLVAIGDGTALEYVLVVSMTGALWHVIRGQQGSTAIIHEAGTTVARADAEPWEGFAFPYAWPEGEQWAREQLAILSKPRVDVNVHISHFRGDQLTIAYGSVHAVDVATEGPPGRWTGSGRAIGWSTDAAGAETEIVLEWQ